MENQFEKIIALAMITPEELLLEHLWDAIKKVRIEPNEENKLHLTFCTIVYATKQSSKGKSITSVLNELSNMKDLNNLFKNKN